MNRKPFLSNSSLYLRLSLLFCCVLMVLLRVAVLDSDAYARLSWSSALMTDEGFYIHNARNVVLFGRFTTDEFNNALIMPLLHLVQLGVFKVFGVSVFSARAISVVCSLLSLLVFFGALRRAFGLRVAWLGVILLGLDPVFVQYNRLALMDTPAVLPLCLAFAAWCSAQQGSGEGKEREEREERERKEWGSEEAGRTERGSLPSSVFRLPFPLLLCGFWLGAAYCVRGLTALVVPVPFLLALVSAAPVEKSRRSQQALHSFSPAPLLLLCAGLAIALLPYLFFWHLPHHRELAFLNAYYLKTQLIPHSFHKLVLNVEKACFHRYYGLFPYFIKRAPTLLAGSLLWIVFRVKGKSTLFASTLFAKEEKEEADRDEHGTARMACADYLLGWLSILVVFVMIVDYSPSRYYILFYPPLAGLAALAVDHLLQRVSTRAEANAGRTEQRLIVLLGFGVATWFAGNLYWYTDWLTHITYKQRDADRWLATHLPPDSVLIGAFAPGLSLNNRFRCVVMIEHLCNNNAPVELYPSAPRFILMLDRDTEPGDSYLMPRNRRRADRWKEPYWGKRYPDLVAPERRMHAFEHILRPFFTIGVYPVPPNYRKPPEKNPQASQQPAKNLNLNTAH